MARFSSLFQREQNMQVFNLRDADPQSWIDPQTLVIYSTQKLDLGIIGSIRDNFPKINVIAASSYHGIFTPEGYRRGSYGIAVESRDALDLRPVLVPFGSDATPETVCARVREALRPMLGSPQKPSHIIMHATPGFEERIIDGIRDVFDPSVAVFGATAANDAFLQKPFIFCNGEECSNGVLLIAVFGSKMACAIHEAGYLPTQKHGAVTSARGRIVNTVGGLPAADVYNAWTDKLFDYEIMRGDDLPRTAGLYPAGFAAPGCDESDDDAHIWISHPRRIDAQTRSLEFFSEIPEGTQICLMRSSPDLLIDQACKTVAKIMRVIDPGAVRTAFVMYCAGCASIIAENMPQLCEKFREAFAGIPFLGISSFGEQGRIAGTCRDAHGNMMIALILIKK